MNSLDIKELKSLFEGFEEGVSQAQKKYLHPKSIRNFLFHFDELSENSRDLVKEKLSAYYEDLNLNGHILSKDLSLSLLTKYITPVGRIYEKELAFKTSMRWNFVFFWGVLFDGCLFLFGIAKFYFQIPICTVALCIRKIYYLQFERKGKMYGLLY